MWQEYLSSEQGEREGQNLIAMGMSLDSILSAVKSHGRQKCHGMLRVVNGLKNSKSGGWETSARQDMRVAEIRVLTVDMERNTQIGVHA